MFRGSPFLSFFWRSSVCTRNTVPLREERFCACQDSPAFIGCGVCREQVRPGCYMKCCSCSGGRERILVVQVAPVAFGTGALCGLKFSYSYILATGWYNRLLAF